VKSFIFILSIVVMNVFGNVCLSHSMQQVGAVHPLHPLAVLSLVLHIIVNPWFDLAVILLLTYTLLYMSALSWLDLSYLLPTTAFHYVITALLASQLLHEQISAMRWVGTSIITLGVLWVGLGDVKTDNKQ
jgi:drug/metabolite transporter (DMT)-like permease